MSLMMVDRWAIQEKMARLDEGPEKKRLRQMLIDDDAGHPVNKREVPEYKSTSDDYVIGGEM